MNSSATFSVWIALSKHQICSDIRYKVSCTNFHQYTPAKWFRFGPPFSRAPTIDGIRIMSSREPSMTQVLACDNSKRRRFCLLARLPGYPENGRPSAPRGYWHLAIRTGKAVNRDSVVVSLGVNLVKYEHLCTMYLSTLILWQYNDHLRALPTRSLYSPPR